MLRIQAVFLLLAFTLPARADLERARRLIDQGRYSQAVQEARAHSSKQAELLEIWALASGLAVDQAQTRLRAFRPDQASMRLYLIVRSQVLDTPEKDLLQALELSDSPEQRVEVLLLLFQATPAPDDRPYWNEAARIAGQHRIPRPLLAQMALAHADLARSQHPEEAWADLAVAEALGETFRAELTRVKILEATGQLNQARASGWKAILSLPDRDAQLRSLLINLRSGKTPGQAERIRLEPLLKNGVTQLQRQAIYRARTLLDLPLDSPPDELLGCLARGRRHLVAQQWEAACTDFQQALELSLAHPHPLSNEVFRSARPTSLYSLLGQLHFALNRYRQAALSFRQAVNAASSEEVPGVRLALQNLLLLHLRTGQVDQAQQTIEEMLALGDSQKLASQRSITYSEIFNQLLLAAVRPSQLYDWGPSAQPIRMDPDLPTGWVFESIRNDPDLQQRIWEAMDRWRDSAVGPQAQASQALYRAVLLASLERPLEAIDSYFQALQIAEASPTLRANIGILLSQELWAQGRRSESLEITRLAYREQSKAPDNPLLSGYRLALAAQLIELGKSPEALPLLEAALSQPEGPNRPLYLMLRGRALGRLDDLKEALRLCKTPEQTPEILFALAQLDPHGSWLEQIKSPDLRTGLRLLKAYQQRSQPDQVVQKGTAILEEFRQTLEQLPSSARAQAIHSPSAREALEMTMAAALQLGRTQEAGQMLSAWQASQARSTPPDSELDQLKVELTGLKNSRAEFLTKLSQLRQRNPEMEASLSAQGNELLTLQPHLPAATLLVQYYLASDAIYIQSVTREGQSLASIRVEKARLKELLARWTAALRRPGPLSQEDLQASRQLYSLLVSPLAGRDNLWIMPSGELWGLPFETLQDPSGRYLVESSSCAYLGPSEALQLVGEPPVPSGQWVGAGNQRLPGTLQELAQLCRLFPQAEVVSDWPSLRAAAGHARYLHLATHSVARPDKPLTSFLELADGPLALDRIYSLSLPPGSLVVLSSCSGATAQSHRERDLISLSSGFRAAGAASVVAALWPVDDEATARFFPPMYQALLAGSSRQQALRLAKLDMLGQPALSHPYFWAAFTLLGDPRLP